MTYNTSHYINQVFGIKEKRERHGILLGTDKISNGSRLLIISLMGRGEIRE